MPRHWQSVATGADRDRRSGVSHASERCTVGCRDHGWKPGRSSRVRPCAGGARWAPRGTAHALAGHPPGTARGSRSGFVRVCGGPYRRDRRAVHRCPGGIARRTPRDHPFGSHDGLRSRCRPAPSDLSPAADPQGPATGQERASGRERRRSDHLPRRRDRHGRASPPDRVAARRPRTAHVDGRRSPSLVTTQRRPRHRRPAQPVGATPRWRRVARRVRAGAAGRRPLRAPRPGSCRACRRSTRCGGR